MNVNLTAPDYFIPPRDINQHLTRQKLKLKRSWRQVTQARSSYFAHTLVTAGDNQDSRRKTFTPLDNSFMLSSLVFSMIDEKGQVQDGFLRAHQIFNLRLPAESVVLSACQTGQGKQADQRRRSGRIDTWLHVRGRAACGGQSVERVGSGDSRIDDAILLRDVEREAEAGGSTARGAGLFDEGEEVGVALLLGGIYFAG